MARVCWPRLGAAKWIRPGVADNFTGSPVTVTFPAEE
jgi:hypothetical protein